MSTTAETMHAVQIAAFGPAENLVPASRPVPVPGPGQVRVRLGYASVNRSDLLLRAGGYHTLPQLPHVPGNEGAGVVDAVGPDVADFAVGDRVVAWAAGGGYAQAMVADANRRVVRVPDGVGLDVAAALPIAWLTASYTAQRLAQVGPQDTVLVYAAASAVGTALVQIAARAGATVVGVVGSPEKAALVRDLGAALVLQRGSEPVADAVRTATGGRGADVVFDLVGGPTFGEALRLAAPLGRVVAIANVALAPSTIDTRDFYPKNVTVFGFQFTQRQILGWDARPDLATLLAQLADGTYVVPIDVRFPLAEAASAHRRLESGVTQGKVLLEMPA